jgi:hypothetical protein
MQRTTNGNLPSPEDVAQIFRRLSDEFLVVPVYGVELKGDAEGGEDKE